MGVARTATTEERRRASVVKCIVACGWYLIREDRGAIGGFEFKGITWGTLGRLVAGVLTNRRTRGYEILTQG